jgi:hypothetical protein
MVLPLRPPGEQAPPSQRRPRAHGAVLAPGSRRGRHPPGTSPTAVVIHDAADRLPQHLTLALLLTRPAPA